MSSGDILCVRNNKLFSSVLSYGGPMHRRTGNVGITHDGLLDSFLVIYDECAKDYAKKDINMSYFVNKYKTLAAEVRSLRVNINDFDLKNTIGRGHFGEVKVAQEKHTDDVFAIKIINKAKTLTNTSASLFEEERDILCTSKSPWLVGLEYAFQDAQNLYLVMEYLPGGDLLSLLQREGGRLNVDHARFYVAETVLAVHDLHRMGYVHRDIKPENLLLDRMGHIKLIDFGSAARVGSDGRVVTAMPAGTPDYIAPEVLKALEGDKDSKVSYGTECDLWSIGVLTYHLVTGTRPFSAARTSVTYSRIMSYSAVSYPESVSVTDSLKDFINSLLRPAATRLDHHAIKKHLFFLEIDFNNLRESVPPIVPVVAAPDDTSNFSQPAKKSPEPALTPREGKEFSGRQLPFVGFTFSGYLNQAVEPVKKKDPSMLMTPRQSLMPQADLEKVRKENQELLTRLLSAQRTSRSSDGDAAGLQRDLARERQATAALKKIIEQEREDRQRDEQKALLLVTQEIQARDRQIKALTTESQAKVDHLNECLTEAHTRNNELTSRCDRGEALVAALTVEVEQLRTIAAMHKDKMAKARESRRRSVTDIELQLDKIQQQEDRWRSKFNAEIKAKQDAMQQAHDAAAALNKAEEAWREERCVLDEEARQLRHQLHELESQLTLTAARLSDTTRLDTLSMRLQQEQAETARLNARIISLETDLSNTTQSFLEHETSGQKSTLKELEEELKKTAEEKIQLQSSLQTMQEREAENRVSLLELEKVLDTLEKEVKKLEQENAELRKAGPDAPKLASEAEVEFRQQIDGLEQKVKKLEGQLERRLDAAIVERQELRDTQDKVRKIEKELSDARLDVRIAKREVKNKDDLLVKLREELKLLGERLRATQQERETQMEHQIQKLDHLREQLSAAQDEVQELRQYKAEASKLSEAEKRLQSEYNTLRQQLLTTERALAAARAQVDSLQASAQTLANEKAALGSQIEGLRRSITNLEVNNTLLKETSAVLEEQLEDYEKLVTDQNANIDTLRQDNAVSNQLVARLEKELSETKLTLSSERTTLSETKQRADLLRADLNVKTELVDELRKQIEFTRDTCDALSNRLKDKEQQVRELEMELTKCDQELRDLEAQRLWYMEKITAQITENQLHKETRMQLTQDLEDRTAFCDSLHDRIEQLEKVLTDLDTFHKQREIKDKDHIGQLNKVISFLQNKLEEKKKKTFANKLFGAKRREPPSPQAPTVASPKNQLKPGSDLRKRVVTPRKGTDSPRSAQALSQIVNSPTTRMQRQISLPRMHHKIPHRFKTQTVSATCKCASCHGVLSRGSKASMCTACPVTVHPNCAAMAPKTCGLPPELAQHFVQTVAQADKEATTPAEPADPNRGWLSLIMPGETSWKRRYIHVDGAEVLIYDSEPSGQNDPCTKWPLVKPGGQTIVADEVSAEELPQVAKSDLPFVIKVVSIPQSTCWPAETHYLLVSHSADKTKWLTALQSAVSAAVPSSDVSSKMVSLFTDAATFGVNCVEAISSQVVLLGTNSGLFSLQTSSTSSARSPVKMDGVTSVHALTVAAAVNQMLLVVGESRRLVSTDYRLAESNASAASCSQPGIQTEVVSIDDEQPVEIIQASSQINGVLYLAAATTKQLHILKWCVITCQFVPIRSVPLSQHVSCLEFYNDALIVGAETFHLMSLHTFSVKEIMNSRVSQGLLRLRSFPMHAVILNEKEMLLCYREFGIFVNVQGVKTRPDLKWAQSPTYFGYNAPFLFILSGTGVEIVRLTVNTSLTSESTSTCDDAMSIATTATLCDNATVPLDQPKLLGLSSKAGVYVRSGVQVLLLDARLLCPNLASSCNTLDRVESEGAFSFTSSLEGSLEGNDSSDGCPSPKKKMQHTDL